MKAIVKTATESGHSRGGNSPSTSHGPARWTVEIDRAEHHHHAPAAPWRGPTTA
jgi:hypothetical protein